MRLLLVTTMAMGCTVTAAEQRFEVGADNVDGVDIQLGNGDLDVYVIDGDAILVDADVGGLGIEDAVIVDGTLVLDFGGIAAGGDVSVGLPGDRFVNVSMLHGDLDLHGLEGPVAADVRAGSITGDELLCDTVLTAWAGSIDVAFAGDFVHVDARASMGAVDVVVPIGDYQLDVAAGIGAIELVDVRDDPSARGRVRARTGLGSVSVWGR